VNGTGYRLLGYAVWHGGKWYLRQKLPSARKLALTTAAAGVALGVAAALVRRTQA
jgi:hypothetical protein